MILLDIPRRLALILALQVVACLYCVLGVGAMVKAGKSGMFLPPHVFTLWIKNWGWLLMLLPCAWFVFHVRSWWKEGADFGLLRSVVVTGLLVLAIIVGCAYVGTAGALRVPLIRFVN